MVFSLYSPFPQTQESLPLMVSYSQSPSPCSALSSFCPREHQSKAISKKSLGAQAAIGRRTKLSKNTLIHLTQLDKERGQGTRVTSCSPSHRKCEAEGG